LRVAQESTTWRGRSTGSNGGGGYTPLNNVIDMAATVGIGALFDARWGSGRRRPGRAHPTVGAGVTSPLARDRRLQRVALLTGVIVAGGMASIASRSQSIVGPST
jgi:hypothetical protein